MPRPLGCTHRRMGLLCSQPLALQSGHRGNWPGIKVGPLPRFSPFCGDSLFVCTRLSVPRSSLAMVLSTTQLFPNLTHQPLPRAMGRS